MLKYMSVPDDERNVETCSIVLWRNIILSCVAVNRTLCTVSTDDGEGHTLTETKNYLKCQITTFIKTPWP
jgi:hypothetical protein